MKIVVGLGNPESRYASTYHNVGFNVVDLLASKLDMKFKKVECRGILAIKKDIVLVKPQTYMNLSGECFASLVSKFKVEPSDIMVVYDDIDIDACKIRMRKSGSGGTHNGMRSIISCIKTNEFPRLRMGIGRPQNGQDLASFVLSSIPKDMHKDFLDASNKACEGLIRFLNNEDVEKIMCDINN